MRDAKATSIDMHGLQMSWQSLAASLPEGVGAKSSHAFLLMAPNRSFAKSGKTRSNPPAWLLNHSEISSPKIGVGFYLH